MQLPLIVPVSDWRPPKIDELPNWAGAKRIAIDIETYDPTLKELGPGVRRNGYIVGVSFAIEDGPSCYLPLRHQGGDNMENPEKVLGWLKQQSDSFTGEITGANLSYDCDWLFHIGIKFPNIKMFRDIQIAEPLIWEFARSYSLEAISQKYLGVGKNEGTLREAATAYHVDPKKDLWQLPARYVGAYAEADAKLPLIIMRRQEREIETQELQSVFDMESRLLPVLVRMRQRGVRIDTDHLNRVEEWSKAEERKALDEVKHLTGVDIPFNSCWTTAGLVPALRHIGVTIPLTPKTKKPSIDKAFLESIKHPVATAINRARRVNKIRTTFVNSIREHMVNGKIHATFHQLRSSDDDEEEGGHGARFGRCSSSNPNLQQQPARDPEIGPFWRKCFIPEPGELWCSADYKAQEPKQAVHYASTTKLGKVKIKTLNDKGEIVEKWVSADDSAKEMARLYCEDAKTDPHQALANIIEGRIATKDERSKAKIIFLALSYGMGGSKLCRSLEYPTIRGVYDGISKSNVSADSERGRELIKEGRQIREVAGPEGQALLDKFDASVPFVRALAKVFTKAANTYGYIRGYDGRKYRFLKDDNDNIIDAHKAMNKAIQGSSAGQTKAAMIELDRANLSLILQVHDECCLSIKKSEEGKMISQIMQEVYNLSVPFSVDVEIGDSWGEAK